MDSTEPHDGENDSFSNVHLTLVSVNTQTDKKEFSPRCKSSITECRETGLTSQWNKTANMMTHHDRYSRCHANRNRRYFAISLISTVRGLTGQISCHDKPSTPCLL
ncbi:hypothetical protein CEXT_521371 [Caerostris extrusa]|uniref:Uncharacterized protein n=1 Tax=Caerostris extrusa TaxID=172846 RepID=A0AAV4V4A6_CAEEX|nr:hypothetical protein CEXT_521371 [Caerostris extrusa]